ncbi:MFS transporter, partial [Pseudomonas aeruginosa]|uniref:MFS transporter n=1 Tax=Pseudomonas aeruginosa TaxID=287 RepID=UPI0018DDB7FE
MLAKVLTDRWCKLQVFFWTNIVLAVFSCAFYFFNPHATTLIMVLYFLLNILHQIPSPLHWSLMSDVDDYGEWKTGKRVTGISFSGKLFFPVGGVAFAEAVVWVILAWCAYAAGSRGQSFAVLHCHSLLWSVMRGGGELWSGCGARRPSGCLTLL